MNIKICIIFPIDLFGPKIGGIGTFLTGFIKYSPNDFQIEFIGITSDKIKRPVKRRQQLKIGDKELVFYPISFEKDENRKTIIPLVLRFTFALRFVKLDLNNTTVALLNRIEPILSIKNQNCKKIGFIHNDIEKQIHKKGSEVFWSHFAPLYFMFESLVFPCFDYIYSVSINFIKYYIMVNIKPNKTSFCFFLHG